MIFFTVAFAPALAWVDPTRDASGVAEVVPLLGAGPLVPLWAALGAADWGVKVLVDLLALLPFRLAIARYAARLH